MFLHANVNANFRACRLFLGLRGCEKNAHNVGMFIELSIERVRAYRKAREWSVVRLAKEAGLRESTIRHIDTDDWHPSSTTLMRLEGIIPPAFMPAVPKPKRVARG